LTKKKKNEEPKVDEENIKAESDQETCDEREEKTEEKTEEKAEEKAEEKVVELTTEQILENTLKEKENAFLRLTAEYQNYRKRVEKEKFELMKYANEKIMVDLLEIMDNFERALYSVDLEHEKNKSMVDGVNLIKNSLHSLMDKYEVVAIDSINNPFDPELQSAVMMEEKEGVESGIVIEEFQKGYKLKDKVIRHAMVKVSQ
jgi:molecular chaperone GrpE